MTENLLGRETSPYLLQHKDNPVHWRAWSQAALEEARQSDRPILLSVGYAACHWCHVMAHECFENADIAALINTLYVPIKVDREERPDLDAIYQSALALMGQQGGWPLTMFLTPGTRPFWGGTYFPPTSKWGRPGFPDVLRGVAETYRADRAKVDANVGILTQGLSRLSQPQAAGPVEIATLDRVAERLAGSIDPINGGFGTAPKFPNCSNLELLWRGYRRTGDIKLRDVVLLSLDHMSQGGIYDHLGGGYARYSTDAQWLAPHFEKMLYDNAQLIDLLTAAWQDTGNRLYRDRVEETIGWLLREMRDAGGAFAATLDADSEHEEGKFYIWSEAEIDRLLGADAALFKTIYDVTSGGNWEGKTILNRLDHPALEDDTTEMVLARCRTVLFDARAPRVRPGRDDKVLADWNGLMISALAHAATVFDRPDWLLAARESWEFIIKSMVSGNHRLVHSWCAGQTHPGNLDDHAALARAGLALFEATGDIACFDQSEYLVETVQRHFAAPGGGYYFAADDTADLIARTLSATDAAVPSGNGIMLQVLVRLSALTANPIYRLRAEALIAAFSGEIEQNFFPLAAYLNGVDLFARALQIVVIGTRDDARDILDVIHRVSLPNLVLTVIPPDDTLPNSHPAYGKTQIAGRATAYICEGQTCSLPFADADALADALRTRRQNSVVGPAG